MSEDAPQQQQPPQQPPQSSLAPADLLRQTELLANQNKERESKLAESEAKNAALMQQMKKLRESFVATAKPEHDKFKNFFETSRGRSMTPDEAALYENIYFNPEATQAKAMVEEEMRIYNAEKAKHVAVTASLEEMQKKMTAMEAQNAEWKAVLAKMESASTNQTTTRAAYAAALDNDAPPVAEEPARRSVSLAAGANDGDISLPPVAPGLLPFLKQVGYTNNPRGEVVAGAFDEGTRHFKPVRTSMPPIPTNPIEYNSLTGERNFAASWKYTHPPNMSHLCNSNLASIPTSVLEQAGNGTQRIYDHKLAFMEQRYTPEYANTL